MLIKFRLQFPNDFWENCQISKLEKRLCHMMQCVLSSVTARRHCRTNLPQKQW